MPHEVTAPVSWSDDERENVIEVRGEDGELLASESATFSVTFKGRRNRLVLHRPARLADLVITFDCGDGLVEIGPSSGVPALHANMRVGQDGKILLGRNVSSTSRVGFSAVEGATIRVGEDVMFASENQLRADDGHPIFDVRTKRRVNPARDITVGAHVWVGWGAFLLGGTTIGDGSVVGLRSVVKGTFPNNCVLAGVPARVVRRHVAWERPHLSLTMPFYKPDASKIETSPYWALTEEEPVESRARRLRRAVLATRWGRALRKAVRRARRGRPKAAAGV